MRHGNLPDGGHDKVTWKRSRDPLTRRRENVTQRRGGDVPQQRYWVFHLGVTGDVVETYRWDVVIMFSWDIVTSFQKDVVETYYWDVLATFHWEVVGCFIWDVPATSLERTLCCWVGYFIAFNILLLLLLQRFRYGFLIYCDSPFSFHFSGFHSIS